MVIEVIPEKRVGVEHECYSYSVPDAFADKILIGSIVEIPFGKKRIRGVVREVRNNKQVEESFELKEALSVEERFAIPNQYLKIAEWISKYYLCSLGEAISLFLPPKISRLRDFRSSKFEVRIQFC